MENYTKYDWDNLREQLNTAVLCDILDELGYREQALDNRIMPLDDSYKLIGVAKTILAYDVYEMPQKPYETEIEAVDSIQEGEVVMICTNNSLSNGIWGELLACAAIARGARGAIIDGAVRDILQLRQMGGDFPVFAAGRSPLDSKGRCLVADYDCPVRCGDVLVNPGDILFADLDGAVVIPSAVAEEAFRLALEKISGENRVREELRGGAKLGEVFAKYGIL